jgi:translation initiation factor 2 gamma subunit (eIF-2gamma)
MRVEVLYFEGCPGHERLMPTLLALAGAHDAEIVQHRVDTPE